MEILQHYNLTRLMAFIPKIRKSAHEWRIIEASLSDNTSYNIALIAKKMAMLFNDKEGVVFICNQREILALIRTGKDIDASTLAFNVNKNMPEHSCATIAERATPDGLKKLEIKLEKKKKRKNQEPLNLFETRRERNKNIIMVVDDDSFMHALISKVFTDTAQIIGIDDKQDIVEAYLEHLPDILFLDIQMPRISGMAVLEEVLKYDDTAHIVIISSYSNRDNVLKAQKLGAKGFLAKPFSREKLETCYKQCQTISGKRPARGIIGRL